MSKEYTNELLLDFGEDGSTLIPVVTQDYNTKEVLILAFANKEAFEETIKSGYATYWSRRVQEIRINCEQNSLLYMVVPEGKGACHAKRDDGSPHTSCYYRKINTNKILELIEK